MFHRRFLAVLPLAAGLGIHVWTYRFLTDDAFISFRYARNFAAGDGLVFNPGSEPVEGYSNFLWVIILGGLDRLGVPPETGAPWLGVVATAVLWGGSLFVGGRLLPPEQRTWLWLLAPTALAANRSFAVWTTGGLEARLVELLLLTGLLSVCRQIQSSKIDHRQLLLAPVLFALAVLTRLDAILVAVAALLGREIWLWRHARFSIRTSVVSWAVFLAPITAHFLWRLNYYGYPLPNTYYAKLADQSSVSLGLSYVAFFLVEYALILWIPFVVDGIRLWKLRSPGAVDLLFGALFPYLAYVVYAGGDHFEFRFLDILWVPLALLLQSGVAYRAARLRTLGKRLALYGGAMIVIAMSGLLPTLSHLDFPEGNLAGFPGFQGRPSGDRNLIRPETAPEFTRLSGFREWLATYNLLARNLTSHYVALRQESHRQAAEVTIMLGRQLRQMVDEGYIPEDTKIAIGAVGAIPYYSRLWTLDRVGLCDAHVAHSAPLPGKHMLAHSKMAEPWYIALSGVELNAVHPYSFIVQDKTVERTKRVVVPQGSPNYYVARLGPDTNFLTHFPQGPGRTLPRFPRLGLVPIAEWEPLDSN